MPETTNIRQTATFSASVQLIIGRAPSWPVRMGAVVVASIFGLALLACCLIRYPETVDGPVVLTSSVPPSRVVARYTSSLDTILVANNSVVMEGDIVAVLKSSASYVDIDFCRRAVQQFLSGESVGISTARSLQLGDIQDYWSGFISSIEQYEQFLQRDELKKKTSIIRGRAIDKQKYLSVISDKIDIQEKDVQIQQKELIRMQSLHDEALISDSEFESEVQVYYSKKMSLSSMRAEYEQVRVSIDDAQHAINELQLEYVDKMSSLELNIKDAANRLSGAISRWIETHTLVATSDGVITYSDFWNKGQSVQTGQVVACITPSVQPDIFGIVKIPSERFGKVRLNQRVNIRLNGFPYTEFGILKGTVSFIDQVPEKAENGSILYTVKILIPEGMKTSYGKVLPVIPEMDGLAAIEVEQLRLIHYIIAPLRSLVLNSL